MSNPFAKIDPVKMLNPNIDQNMLKQEIETNPIIKLQMSDQSMIAELTRNPDPKQAEMLIERKMRAIGMTDKEIVVVMMRDGHKYPLQRALSETGLSEYELNDMYDSAVAKINAVLGGGGLVANAKNIFSK